MCFGKNRSDLKLHIPYFIGQDQSKKGKKGKKEWGLVRRGLVVSGLFFRSCSLGSLILASILKVIEIQMCDLLEAFGAWSLFSFASR